MKKIEALRKKYDEAVNKKAAMQAEIQKLKADTVTLSEEADAAAQAGNISLYREKRDASQLAADTAHVRERQLEIFTELQPIEDGREAWKEYAGEYGKNFDRAQKALEKAQADLRKAFLELVEIQNEGLHVKDQIREYVGSDSFADVQVDMLPTAFQRSAPSLELSAAASLYKLPEYIYLLDRQLLTVEQAKMINAVARCRYPV